MRVDNEPSIPTPPLYIAPLLLIRQLRMEFPGAFLGSMQWNAGI